MTDRDAIRRAYDELAAVYAGERSADGRGQEILSAFLEACPPEPLVLDAGCGQGTPVLERLANDGPAVGLDVSGAQLALAADAAPTAALVQGDMTTLPFADRSFDAVVAFWSLIHVPMDAHARVIAEFGRVLRPDGRLLVCEGTDEWEGENPDWLDTGVRMAWNVAGAAATREQLRDAGFAVERTWGAPETLDPEEETDDGGEDDGDESDDWVFFDARLGEDA